MDEKLDKSCSNCSYRTTCTGSIIVGKVAGQHAFKQGTTAKLHSVLGKNCDKYKEAAK